MEEAINWSRELKKIGREFDGLPPEPTPEDIRARREEEEQAERLKQELVDKRTMLLHVWGRVALVGLLSFAIAFWPYSRSCGFGLFTYMLSNILIIVGGLWASVYGWHFRIARAHGLALAMVLWGFILITAQVLPRNGYAKVDPHNPPTWFCHK